MQITAILLRTTALVSTFFLGVVAPPPGQIQCSGGVAFRGVYKNKKPIRQYFTHAEDQIKSWSGGTCNPSCQVTPGDYRFGKSSRAGMWRACLWSHAADALYLQIASTTMMALVSASMGRSSSSLASIVDAHSVVPATETEMVPLHVSEAARSHVSNLA